MRSKGKGQGEKEKIVTSPLVIAYGGGVDSTALLIELARRYRAGDKSARPQLILFADTGAELPNVYAYVRMFSRWLVCQGFPPIKTVRHKGRLTLEQDCLKKKNLPGAVYHMPSNSCSGKFKVGPQNQYVAKWTPAKDAWRSGLKVTKMIGFEANERGRMFEDDDRYHYVFPLVDWGWDRQRCEFEIRAEGLPVPAKSACWCCPNMKKPEIRAMRARHPVFFQKAIDMERVALQAGTLRNREGLGGTFSWEGYLAELVAEEEKKHEDSQNLARVQRCREAGKQTGRKDFTLSVKTGIISLVKAEAKLRGTRAGEAFEQLLQEREVFRQERDGLLRERDELLEQLRRIEAGL